MKLQLFILFYSAVFICAGQTSNTSEIKGPIIKFDFSTIVDTIKQADINSAGLVHNKPITYYFPFTNSGTEPLIVEMSQGSGPDFNCYYPKYPIKPEKRDSIGICVPETRLTLNKKYRINCNSLIPQTITIIRIRE